MPRLDRLIFGYRKISFEKGDAKVAAGRFLKCGIAARFLPNRSVTVAEAQLKKAEKALDGHVRYTVSEPLGLFGALRRQSSRYGVIAALLLSLLFVPLSSCVVWDVRVIGAEIASEEDIVAELAEAGLRVGIPWFAVDNDRVEAELLANSELVSWVNVNRRGTVAYVSVIDKAEYTPEAPKVGYANVVASRDCVVEEITVKRGYPVVKAGETVKKGQLLISGVIPAELGGGLCYAEGTVVGSYSDFISVSVESREVKKVAKERAFCGFSINFFGFSAKLLKIYRKTEDEYVIINDDRRASLLGKKLPIGTVREYVLEYTSETVAYSESEMAELAFARMNESLSLALRGATLLKIKTQGSFSGEAYTVRTDYLCSATVSEALEFFVENDG